MKFLLQTRRRRFVLYTLTILAGVVFSCLVLAVIGYNSNQKLPVGPAITDRMDPLDKARLAEALHLKAELGDVVWPGYLELDAPVIIWNEDYEFLFLIDNQPPGWVAVLDDEFQGNPYFRRPAEDPQNFAVPVGDQLAASVFNKYTLDTSLINAIKDLLPPLISDIFPYQIFIQPSELQITGVQHEYFHVLQGLDAPAKFADAQRVYEYDEQYWSIDREMRPAWGEEVELLINAVEASSEGDAAELGWLFLDQRDQRRQNFELGADLVNYEVSLEWLEGVAKYHELRSWQFAGQDPGYSPITEIATDPDFTGYTDFDGQWSQALRQTRRQSGEEGDVRFYYTGMLQAYLLDRLMPSWKMRIMEDGVTLESLLREVLEK